VLSGGGLLRIYGGWSQVLAMKRKGDIEEFDERILGSGDFVQGILLKKEWSHKASGISGLKYFFSIFSGEQNAASNYS